MNFLNKLIGSSKFQEEFTKCIGFQWTLAVENFSGIEYTRKQSTIRSNFNKSSLLFDFELNELLIVGDLISEVFEGTKHYVITKKEVINSEHIFLFSKFENDNVIMKCTVRRYELFFEGTLTNWSCKIPYTEFLNLKQIKRK